MTTELLVQLVDASQKLDEATRILLLRQQQSDSAAWLVNRRASHLDRVVAEVVRQAHA
jgi:hypothetical protein